MSDPAIKTRTVCKHSVLSLNHEYHIYLCPAFPVRLGKVCIRATVAHQAGAYPGFCSMKQLGVFLLPPGWDASPSQGYPPALSLPVPIYTPGWRGTVRVKCLAQEHNTMSPARAQTRTARSGVERTNHEATAPPTIPVRRL